VLLSRDYKWESPDPSALRESDLSDDCIEGRFGLYW
ncbi:unnamed protein product, partial [marine sediment metagenome]